MGRPTDTGSHRVVGRSTDTGSHRVVGRSTGTGSHRVVGSATGTGSHRVVGDAYDTGSFRVAGRSTDTGSHRAIGKAAGRRKIAKWPIACVVLAALLVLGWLGWGWADGVLNSRAEAEATNCAEGDAAIRVVVTPSAEKPVAAAANRWNQARTVVHSHCINIRVEAMPSERVLNALTGRSNLDAIGGLPAAWLPEASWWVGELTTAKPELVGSRPESVASARSADYPYLGLAGKGVDDVQQRAAQAFRDYLKQPAQQADFVSAGLKAT
ncbi:hypothetical protein [Amycolatopsis anabasis]|uniref:hypothetical protein n=1 Tax=Amycolatopsis anabasis TaxID=1840409 RepID=UPI003CCD87C0